ncbi:MAG: YaaA family protein, partial [Pseudonocardiaceae bacterium]
LVALAADVPACLRALGLAERQSGEVARNANLLTSPTMPALRRYTGVLYDALDAASFTRTERARAENRLAIASALFGVVRASDAIPGYRLSGGTALPGVGTLRGVWRPVLEPALAEVSGLLVDLRSGTYSVLAKTSGAVTVRVVTEDGAGRRKTVSHHNKAYKGHLASVLACARREPSTMDDVLHVAVAAGFKAEQIGAHQLELLTE